MEARSDMMALVSRSQNQLRAVRYRPKNVTSARNLPMSITLKRLPQQQLDEYRSRSPDSVRASRFWPEHNLPQEIWQLRRKW